MTPNALSGPSASARGALRGEQGNSRCPFWWLPFLHTPTRPVRIAENFLPRSPSLKVLTRGPSPHPLTRASVGLSVLFLPANKDTSSVTPSHPDQDIGGGTPLPSHHQPSPQFPQLSPVPSKARGPGQGWRSAVELPQASLSALPKSSHVVLTLLRTTGQLFCRISPNRGVSLVSQFSSGTCQDTSEERLCWPPCTPSPGTGL